MVTAIALARTMPLLVQVPVQPFHDAVSLQPPAVSPRVIGHFRAHSNAGVLANRADSAFHSNVLVQVPVQAMGP